MPFVRRASSEPVPHRIGEAIASATCIRSPASDGPFISTTTPPNPSASASHSRAVGRASPRARRPTDSEPRTPTHSGIVALTTAVPPDDTPPVEASARQRQPLPPRNSSVPTGAARSQSRSAGHAAPRRFAIASIAPPAARNRMLAASSGGSSATATRIARYVELQIR